MNGTESINEALRDLDLQSTLEVVSALATDQRQAIEAVIAASAGLARAADLAVERLQRGGRLVYAGAGTSGRLAFLDAAELTPTFSWPMNRALVCMAGGDGAVRQAVEGAEDDRTAGRQAALALGLNANDVLIAVAASGTTPYALGALDAALEVGALRIGVANNPGTPVLAGSEVPILLDTGAEAISGSTRLKAGTAQKIALNTLSSTIMVRLGKVYGNLMVDVQATNAKLVGRAIRLTVAATGADADAARATLEACGWHVKTAIIMLERKLNADQAKALLGSVDGHVRAALSK